MDNDAGIRFPPPLVFLGFVLLGPLAERALALPRVEIPWPAGAVVLAVGIAIIAATQRDFFRRGENPAPWTPTNALIDTGLYGRSRNPMYLGMAIAAAGLALLLDSWLGLLLTGAAVAVIQRRVIAREEAYLDRVLGEPYRAYRRRVRRWL